MQLHRPARNACYVFCAALTRALWKSFRDGAGIAYTDLMKYYRGHKLGTGIRVKEAYSSPTPLCLLEDLGIDHPPPSYRYLEDDPAKKVLLAIVPIYEGARPDNEGGSYFRLGGHGDNDVAARPVRSPAVHGRGAGLFRRLAVRRSGRLVGPPRTVAL